MNIHTTAGIFLGNIPTMKIKKMYINFIILMSVKNYRNLPITDAVYPSPFCILLYEFIPINSYYYYYTQGIKQTNQSHKHFSKENYLLQINQEKLSFITHRLRNIFEHYLNSTVVELLWNLGIKLRR